MAAEDACWWASRLLSIPTARVDQIGALPLLLTGNILRIAHEGAELIRSMGSEAARLAALLPDDHDGTMGRARNAQKLFDDDRRPSPNWWPTWIGTEARRGVSS